MSGAGEKAAGVVDCQFYQLRKTAFYSNGRPNRPDDINGIFWTHPSFHDYWKLCICDKRIHVECREWDGSNASRV